MTDITVHTTIQQKRKKKKALSINHTAAISSSYTAALDILVRKSHGSDPVISGLYPLFKGEFPKIVKHKLL
jgi:hypothetical protein